MLATLILSDKSSGSTALIEALTAGTGAHHVSFTQHQEHETLFWWKAATVLGFSQPALRSTRLPLNPIRARYELEDLLERNEADLGAPLEATTPEELVFDGWAALCHRYSPCFVEKSPHHLHHWQALGLMRSAPQRVDRLLHRYIGLVRHPHATLASMWRRWGVDPQRAQWEWLRAYRNLVRLARVLGSELLIVRYEDLVADQGTWESVWSHVGLEGAAPPGRFDETRASAHHEDPRFEFHAAEPVIELARELGYADTERDRARRSAAWTLARARSRLAWTARRWRRRLRERRPLVPGARVGPVLPPRRRLLCVSSALGGARTPTSLVQFLERGGSAHVETTVLFGEPGPVREDAVRLGLAVEDVDDRSNVVTRYRELRRIMRRSRPDVLYADEAAALSRDVARVARARRVPVVWVRPGELTGRSLERLFELRGKG